MRDSTVGECIRPADWLNVAQAQGKELREEVKR